MNVVYITDSNYAMPTCVSIVSLIENNKHSEGIIVYIIADNLTENEKLKFIELSSRNVDIRLIEVSGDEYDNLHKNCANKGIHVSRSSLYKFSLCNLLIDEKVVLYLDGDIIVNKDISKLFDMKLSNYLIAAAEDMGDKHDDINGSYYAGRIGLKTNKYFNSGVMLLNLDRMREERITDKLIEFRRNETNYFMDQDAFNYVCNNRILYLSTKYNFLSKRITVGEFDNINCLYYAGKYSDANECIRDQCILHMTDKYKPWLYNIRFFTDIFMEYFLVSPYSDRKLILRDGFSELYNQNIELGKQLKYKKWKFPQNKIHKGAKIVIYGIGDIGTDYIEWINDTGYCSIVLKVDGNRSQYTEDVYNPERIKSIEYDYIVIAAWNRVTIEEIRERLMHLGVNAEKIVSY